jgi:hypothetical protein
LSINPNDAAAQITALTELSGVSADDVTTIVTLNTAHAPAISAAQKVDPTTLQTLAAHPTDQRAGIKAVSEISGVSATDVATIAQLNAQHANAIAAGKALDAGTAAALITNPKDKAALAKAVGEVVSKLHVSQADAAARLQELAKIPVPQLLLLQQSGQKVVDAQAALVDLAKIPPAQLAVLQSKGPQVAKAGDQLKALGAAPAADLGLVAKYGPSLQEPKVQKILTQVAKAKSDSPKQWRNYFWIAVGGEVVFIPLIFLLAGAWSPATARRKEREHEEWVQAELAKLKAQG